MGIRDFLVEFSKSGLAVGSLGDFDGIVGRLGVYLVLLELLEEGEDVVDGVLAVGGGPQLQLETLEDGFTELGSADLKGNG